MKGEAAEGASGMDEDEAARRASPWCRDGLYRNSDEIDHWDADPDGFLALEGARRSRWVEFLRWRLSGRARPELKDAPDTPLVPREIAPEDLRPPEKGMRVTWLGHASLWIATPQLTIALDPLFGAPPLVKRVSPPPLAAERIPAPDLLVLTHNHHDHLAPRAIEALFAARNHRPLDAIVPSGLAGWMRRRFGAALGKVTALEWWRRVTIGGVTITAVPAHHWSKRGLTDTRRSHWSGYVFEGEGRRLYVAGDTAHGGHFAKIAARFEPFHAGVVPIGAYSPRWFMREVHMDPHEAVDAARIARVETILPVHFGTLRLSDEPLGEPPLLLARAAETAERRVEAWRPGDGHFV